MAGFTNDVFRRVLHRFGGVGLYTTEMLHARGLLEMAARRKGLHSRLAGIPLKSPETPIPSETVPYPLALQLWDNDADRLAEIAEKLAKEYEIAVFDLNFGCPEHDVTLKSHSGAWLLQFPEKIEKIVRHVTAAAGEIPVTAKIRLGFSAGDYSAPEVVQAVESAGAAAVTVHGRTAEQMYSGTADWEKIADLRRFLRRIPLIGNGDITSPEEAARAFLDYGVDGVMIGRACLSAPWFFRQTAALLRGEPEEIWRLTPSPAEQKTLLEMHFSLLLSQNPPRDAIIQMRKFAPRYGVGLKNARHFRLQVAQMSTPEEFTRIVEEFFSELIIDN